jgi:hypothetical protein
MSDYVVTLYEIRNAANLVLDYRLVGIEGFLGTGHGDEDLVDRNLNLLAKLVATRERTPVAIIRRGDTRLLAVPADRTLKQFEYSLTPTVVRLQPETGTHSLRLSEPSDEHRHIALKFIEFSLRGPLNGDPELWAPSPRTFLQKRPINYRESDREADLYEGFHFHLRFFDGRLFLGVSLSYKYIDDAWLVDRFTPDQMRRLKMRHVLYHFGHRWYTVQLLDILGVSIKEARFQPQDAAEATTVFDYTRAENKDNPPPWIQALDPASPAITYRSPGRDQVRFAAAALGKLIYRTDAPEVRHLHRRSIKQPTDRFRFTSMIVERYFKKARFGETALDIAREPHRVSPKIFSIPTLEFGQGHSLRVSGQASRDTVPLSDLPSARMNKLLDPQCGFAVTSPLDAQYVLIPQSLTREIATDFRSALEGAVRGFIHSPYRLEAVLYDDRQARTLKQQVDSIVAALATARVSHGHGVLVLPVQAKSDLHNYVKSKLKDTIQVQCVSASKIQEFYRTVLRGGRGQVEVRPELRGRYTSYLRYTALGLLIVNRQWGWVLKDGTNYDGYVSFDVLSNYAAFSFFYEGGRKCFIRTFPSRQKEKLLRAQVREIVYDALKQDLHCGIRIGSLVLQRDGRLFESEWAGFSDAIKKLIQEKLLPSGFVFGAIEVHKKSTNTVRIARTGIDGLRNPRIGIGLELTDEEGIICNTGYPFRLNGSVNPLFIRVVRGELELSRVLEDAFQKSLLSWPVPDRMIRLPIDLKLCDEFLRAVAADADEDEAVYGEEHERLVDAVNVS